MTRQEASERYHIPLSVLQAYESWNLRGTENRAAGAWEYDDEDLQRLSTILTLRDVGFTEGEMETYMRLLAEQPEQNQERLRMMEEKREETLEEIHFHERQLARLDYLRHELQTK